MNPTEQRDHKRVTDRLAADIRDLDEALEVVDARVTATETRLEQRMDAAFVAAAAGVENQVAGIRADLSALATELFQETNLRVACDRNFTEMPFYLRLWWLLTGRTP